MPNTKNRRRFLTDVGRGMLVATVGLETAQHLELSSFADSVPKALTFGDMEPLVQMMQETPASAIIPALARELSKGTTLRRLTAAAALANARTFGGEDYVGFHTMMALAPALHMADELPRNLQPLPVFKVLYRNSNRIQERGGRKNEVLRPIAPATSPDPAPSGKALRNAVRQQDLPAAERILSAAVNHSPEEAFNYLLYAVQDHTEVHRVVMPYRAWDLMDLIGREQAETILRQSVHYCVQAERWSGKSSEVRELLPKLFDEFNLIDQPSGSKKMEDSWIEETSQAIFKSTPQQAAALVAAELKSGIAPDCLGEALSLAANQLILRDLGRRPFEEISGKPVGSVHGDSIGVHASDSANAWRNMARVSNSRNCHASLILGAYQMAFDRVNRGGDFLHWQPLPVPNHLQGIKTSDAENLLQEIEEAVRGNLQARAAALVSRYGELGFSERPVFNLLLRFAISEDGALHGEKFYRTVTEEFNSTRPAFRWRHLMGLARVTASEFGRPAAGVSEARDLLHV